jgi:hypothetical protein
MANVSEGDMNYGTVYELTLKMFLCVFAHTCYNFTVTVRGVLLHSELKQTVVGTHGIG